MNLIVTQWMLGKVPLLNGVIEANGRVHFIRPVDPPRSLPMILKEAALTESVSLSEAEWTIAMPVKTLRDTEYQTVVTVGECGIGSDGFIAVQETADASSLKWLAFFDFSNPFESVRVERDFVIALNTLGEEWHFDRLSPWKVKIYQVGG